MDAIDGSSLDLGRTEECLATGAREASDSRWVAGRVEEAAFEGLTGRHEVNRDTCSRRVENKTRKEQ
jgi:hypothetical protein